MTKKRIDSRQKGARGEREALKQFEAWWGTPFARTPGSGALHTLGARFKEVEICGDITTTDPTFCFSIEVKNCAGWSLEQLLTAPKCDIYSWWAQATSQCPDHKKPLLVFKRNHHPFLFAMRKSDFVLDIPAPSLILSTGHEEVIIGLATHLWASDPEKWKK